MTHNPPRPDPFEVLAPSYDKMGFLVLTGHHLAAQAALQPGERVLDVATGTGTVALEAARMVGETGQVTGLDLSPHMLAQARARAGAVGAINLNFVEGDGMRLPFGDETFDAVLCASGLFFMPDLEGALREWRRVLRPGGRVGFTAFAPGLMAPLPAMWAACLAPHGLKAPGPPTERLPSAEKARALLEEAGFTVLSAEVDTVVYRLDSPLHRWDDIESGLEGLSMRQLPEETRASVRAAHLTDLEPLFGTGPLSVPLPLIVAFGQR